MKTKTNQTLYFCEHCNKIYRRSNACINHEKWCIQNPANKHACFEMCGYLKRERILDDDNNPPYYFTRFFCTKLNKEMHSFLIDKHIAKKQYYHNDLPEVKENTERMPKECVDWKHIAEFEIETRSPFR